MGKNKQKPKNTFKRQNNPDFQIYFDDPELMERQVPALQKMIKEVDNYAWLGWLTGVFRKALSNATPDQLEDFNNIPGATDILKLIREKICELELKNNGRTSGGLVTLKNLKPEYRKAI